jgi:transcriptional regulator with XRE-family HTH domain
LLGWSQLELAKEASVGVATVRRLEAAGNEVRGSVESVWKIQKALEAAGIEFISAEGKRGPGVRLRQMAARRKRPKVR